MQIAERISELKHRAARINLLWTPLCKEAGVNWANLRDWEEGRKSPILRNLERSLAALERKIAEHEQQILEDLTSAKPRERRAS